MVSTRLPTRHPRGPRPIRPMTCRRTGTSSARAAGCGSTSGCWNWPRTSMCRCWSGSGSWPSSPATWTSSSWSGWPGRMRRMADRPAGRGRHHRACRRTRCSRHTLETARELQPGARRVLPRRRPAGAGRGGHRDPALEGAVRRRAERAAPAVPGPHLPGAHPAGGGPGPSVPLHFRPVAQPGGHDRGPGDRRDHVRPGEGAAAAAPVPHRREVPVRPAGGRDRGAPRPSCSWAWTSSSTTCSG